MKLAVKKNIDLKEFEKYGFEKLEDNYRGHKYSWKEDKGNWFYEIYINRDNYIHIRIECLEGSKYILLASKLQCKLYQLIKDDLVEVVENE